MSKVCEYCLKPCKGKHNKDDLDCDKFEMNTNFMDDDISDAKSAVRKKGLTILKQMITNSAKCMIKETLI